MNEPLPVAAKYAIGAVLFLAILLRVIAFPHLHETRDYDETGYVKGGLAIVEGMTPGYKAAPGAPIYWLGALYGGIQSGWNLIHPPADVAAAPLLVRPYLAVEHALFDLYRDPAPLRRFVLVICQFITVGGVLAAALLGARRAGACGAVFMGGMMAGAPLFLLYSVQSRPYAIAWAFSLMAMAAAALARRRPLEWGGLFMGLAIASRIDMLLLLPIFLWEVHQRRLGPSPWRSLLKALSITALFSLLVAPWILTNLFGNLRAIATIRIIPVDAAKESPLSNLINLAWTNGFAVTLLLILLAWVFLPREGRARQISLLAFISLLALTLARGTGFGLQHQGAVIVALLLGALCGLAACIRVAPKFAPAIALCAILLPLTQGVLGIVTAKRAFVPEESAAWIEQHIKPLSPVLLDGGAYNLLHVPLPTRESSDAIWTEISDISAGERKYLSGIKRFALSSGDVPRAMSREDLIQEQGNGRGWFILGSSVDRTSPRFDIYLAGQSPVAFVLGETAPILEAYKKRGGVLVTAQPEVIAALGKPVMQWTSPDGHEVAIFADANSLLP